MAFHASVLLPNSYPPKIPVKLFGQQQCQVERSLLLGIRQKTIPKCAMKVSMSQVGGPNGVNMQIIAVKEKLEKSLPEPVKEIDWNKASDVFLARLLSLGQKTLKWSIVALFALSCLSDVVFSISRNQELIMPLGLFVGCLMADYFKEVSQEVFPSSQGKGLNWKLIGIGCFFVLVKSVSVCFGLRGKVFLLHVANGGLMQVLWSWRSLLEGIDQRSQDDYSMVLDTSAAVEKED